MISARNHPLLSSGNNLNTQQKIKKDIPPKQNVFFNYIPIVFILQSSNHKNPGSDNILKIQIKTSPHTSSHNDPKDLSSPFSSYAF
jgi:hypothetical protein